MIKPFRASSVDRKRMAKNRKPVLYFQFRFADLDHRGFMAAWNQCS
jgi:hypothetical protein